jgi:hypothetical protein
VDIYELIGFFIGDGYLYGNEKCRIFKLEFVGNVEEDYDYFEEVSKFIYGATGKKPSIKIRKEKRGQGIRLIFYNKSFVQRLSSMGFPLGKKTFTVKIPENMLERDKMISIIRGIFQADGCLYFSKSKKGKYPTYPRLEIKSSSPNLVSQIASFLEKEGFKVYVKKPSSDRTFGVYLNGEKMLEKWRNLIGFSSLKNKSKYEFWKTKGFYMPHTPLNQRLNYLNARMAKW